MEFEFDPEKDAINQAKHGVPLRFAERLFEGPAKVNRDDRVDYGEQRFIAYGLIDGRLFACVFTDCDGARRVISLRKANKREQNAIRQSEQEASR